MMPNAILVALLLLWWFLIQFSFQTDDNTRGNSETLVSVRATMYAYIYIYMLGAASRHGLHLSTGRTAQLSHWRRQDKHATVHWSAACVLLRVTAQCAQASSHAWCQRRRLACQVCGRLWRIIQVPFRDLSPWSLETFILVGEPSNKCFICSL